MGVFQHCEVLDGALIWLGAGGLADVQGASVLSPEGRGDTLPAFEDTSEAGPALPPALLADTPADRLYQLAGDDGDKQVTVGPLLCLVEMGPRRNSDLSERNTASTSVTVL